MTIIDINLTLTIKITCQWSLGNKKVNNDRHQQSIHSPYSNGRYMSFEEHFTRITGNGAVIGM